MVPAIHNYWLGIMALAFAIAMATWIALVFRAGRHPHGYQQNSSGRREVAGGSFVARDGGRQVVPDPREPLLEQAKSEAEGEAGAAQGEQPVPNPRQYSEDLVRQPEPYA